MLTPPAHAAVPLLALCLTHISAAHIHATNDHLLLRYTPYIQPTTDSTISFGYEQFYYHSLVSRLSWEYPPCCTPGCVSPYRIFSGLWHIFKVLSAKCLFS